jgi:2'-5' RNA ligase
MPYRYFFALWPDTATRTRLAEICALLPPGTGKTVTRQNLHITLCFLGVQDLTMVENLRRGAAEIKGRPFSLRLEQSGWWRKPQVVWVGGLDSPTALLDLVTAINRLAAAHGVRTDDRPYQPHLTIARKVTKKPDEIAFDPINWPINSFSLVRSRTLNSGPVYETIETWPLSSG